MFESTSSIPRRVVVAIVVFFPVFLNTLRGLREVDPIHRELMASYAARGWTFTRLVRLPGALPFVFTGLRQASSLAVIAAVVAEYFGGLQDGLGSRITSAAAYTAYPRAWAFVVGACVLGLVFYLAVARPGAPRDALAGSPGVRLRVPTKQTPEGLHMVTTSRRRLGVVAAVGALVAALAGCGTADEPSGDTGTASGGVTDRSSCSCSGSSRPSSPATSPPSTRASTASRASTCRSSRAASTSSRRRCWPRARPTTRSPGCPRPSPRASRAPRSPTSARSSQRSGTYQVASPTAASRRRRTCRARRSATGASATSSSCSPGMTKAGLDPGKDVTLVQQQFDMQALLRGDIDAAQAMSYNEYAQLLEAKNPATGKLYKPEAFTVLDWNDVGTAMLQDAVWANTEQARVDPAYQEHGGQVPRRHRIKGWAYCRDNARGVPRPGGASGLQARREPPAVADERGQQADLAVAQRRRPDRRGGLEADGRPVDDARRTRTARPC